MRLQFKRQGKMIFGNIKPLVMVAACLVLGLSSCDRFGERTKDVIVSIQDLSTGEKLLKNEVSNVELTLPQDWEDVRDDLRPDADLYAAHEDRSRYVLVLADQKRADIANFDLADNAAQYISYLEWGGVAQAQDATPTATTSLNGLNARQYEVRGQIDGQPVVYLHTTVEGSNTYYQVVAWTAADDYEAAKGELQTIVGSFRGT